MVGGGDPGVSPLLVIDIYERPIVRSQFMQEKRIDDLDDKLNIVSSAYRG